VESPGPRGEAEREAAASTAEGVSAFVARVLDQLSLSAWLPAALLTASVAVLLEFRSTRSVNLPSAISRLTADPVRVLVLIIPLLVLATVVTQAFSFEAIRTLEGYWRRRGVASLARTLMIRGHVRRKRRLTKRRQRASEDGFYAARPQMLRDGIDVNVVNGFEALITGTPLPACLTDDQRREVMATNWRSSCDAWRVARVDHLIREEESYPITSRVLPTKLGNVIRATEDELQNAGSDVQGFVLRRRTLVPRRVQLQHDQFRNRLEMYCTLVFVSGLLVILTPIALHARNIGNVAIAVITAVFGALSVASYLASIASARGYCAALKQMDEAPTPPR